jgi:hypothetical protein
MPILGNRLLKRQSVAYLLRDDFTTTAGSPLASPRTAEPGPGTLTLTQTDGQFSISGGKLTYPAQTTPAWGDQGFYAEKQGGGAFTRTTGRTLFVSFNSPNATDVPFVVSWHTSTALGSSGDANSTLAILFEAGGAFRVLDGAALFAVPYTWSNASDELFALVLRSTGSLVFKRIGGTWTLAWVGTLGSTASLYPAFKNYQGVGTLEHIRVRDLPTPFTTDFGLATLNQASPSSGSPYTGDADGLYFMTITAPNPLLGTSAIGTEMRYRVQDSSNYWTAYLQEDGTLKVDSVSGGVATNRLSAASVITSGATITLCVLTNGSKHNVYTLSSSTWTKRGSEINVSHLDAQTTMRPQIGTNWTASNLRSWSRTSVAYSALN